MRGDLSSIGPSFTRPRRIAASATRYEVGEPIHSAATMDGAGVASSNTWVLAAADTVVLGTYTWGGIANSSCKPFKTGTVVAHTCQTACAIPHAGLIRGKGETAASIDTDAEILALINDAVLIDYNATGGTDGGELYTIKVAGSADTSAFAIIDGNPAKATLDVEVYATAYRIDQDVT